MQLLLSIVFEFCQFLTFFTVYTRYLIIESFTFLQPYFCNSFNLYYLHVNFIINT